jgi:glycosyltransferase involved in cell wall biosynthesis
MRIIFLNTSSLESPYTSGRCLPIAQALARRGHDVHIVTLHHNMPNSRALTVKQECITVHFVGQMHVLKKDSETYYFSTKQLINIVVRATVAMFRRGLELGGDIYHIGKPHPQNSVSGLLIKMLRSSVKLFLDYDDVEYISNRFLSSWQSKIVWFLEISIPKFVDGVTYHTRYLGEMLARYGVASDRCLRLPSLIDIARFSHVDMSAIQRWRRNLELPSAKPVVMYIGSLSLANHPVDLLLEAFALLKQYKGVEEARLIIVGGGPDITFLRQYAANLSIEQKCTFVGRVSPSEIPVLLKLATLTVDPVQDDIVARARWPLKIIESLAAGVPVVTGDVGDRREMLADGAAGVLVTPGDARALAEGIAQVLREDMRLATMQQAAREVATRYMDDRFITQLIEFYESRKKG